MQKNTRGPGSDIKEEIRDWGRAQGVGRICFEWKKKEG